MKRKHKGQNLIFQKFVQKLTESGASVQPLVLIGCSAESFVDMQGKVFQQLFSEDESAAETLRFGGGTVRVARITSKGILFAGRKHYNSEYIQNFCGREVLIHEIDGYMRVYLYEEREQVLGGMICVHDMSIQKGVQDEKTR